LQDLNDMENSHKVCEEPEVLPMEGTWPATAGGEDFDSRDQADPLQEQAVLHRLLAQESSSGPEEQQELHLLRQDRSPHFLKLAETCGRLELEVICDFDPEGEQRWLECSEGDVVTATYVHNGYVFVVDHYSGQGKQGWLPLEIVTLPTLGFYEFFVDIAAPMPRQDDESTERGESAARPLGLVWVELDSSGHPFPGLQIVEVSASDSAIADWNDNMQRIFPRSQLIVGDIVTWANEATALERMSCILESWASKASSGESLKLRVLRAGGLRLAADTQAQSFEDLLPNLNRNSLPMCYQ